MPVPVAACCLLHPQRESVARCPECRQAFCRECITEHGGRVICAGCLRQLTRTGAPRASRPGVPLAALHLLAGLLVSWFLFYTLGRILLEIPSEWHESDKAIKLLTR